MACGPANPSSLHLFGREGRARLLWARESIGGYFGVTPKELIFTSGGTEAINFLVRGAAKHLPKGKILTSSGEHSAVEATLADLEKEGWLIERLPVGPLGHVRPDKIQSDGVQFMVFSAVNSETGVRAPIEDIASVAEAKGIPLIVDGVAWLGKEPIILPRGVSGIAFSSHKIHGPKGVGVALARPSLKVAPLLTGGAQESGPRGGTENLEGIVGFAKAVELLQAVDFRAIAVLRDRFEALLLKGCGAQVNGEGARVCTTSNLFFPGIDGETLLIQLDMAGIAASHGSACSSGAQEPSRVLLNMGYGYERAKSSLRFSLSRFTTATEIDRAAALICEIVLALRRF